MFARDLAGLAEAAAEDGEVCHVDYAIIVEIYRCIVACLSPTLSEGSSYLGEVADVDDAVSVDITSWTNKDCKSAGIVDQVRGPLGPARVGNVRRECVPSWSRD